jgi:hypothetical protein
MFLSMYSTILNTHVAIKGGSFETQFIFFPFVRTGGFFFYTVGATLCLTNSNIGPVMLCVGDAAQFHASAAAADRQAGAEPRALPTRCGLQVRPLPWIKTRVAR